MRNSSILTEYKDWLNNAAGTFDLGICMHVPKHVMGAERGFDDMRLSKLLMHYFNVLDRKLFGTQHRKHGKRLQRMVVLGYTDTVGWHAHVAVQAPTGVSAERLRVMMHLLWLRHMRADSTSNTSFTQKLFWAEPIRAGYVGYSLANAKDILGIYSGIHHGNAQASKGTLDILNWHF